MLAELPSCPFLAQLSSAPTRYTAAFEPNPKPEHLLAAASALLWAPQEPAPLARVAALPLPQAFREYVFSLASAASSVGHPDPQRAKPDECLVLRPGNLEALEAASVRSEPSEEGEVTDDDDPGNGAATERAEARGAFHRVRGGEQVCAFLKKKIFYD